MISGRAFARAVRRAGDPGRLRFTRHQLYYELCRGRQPLHRVGRRPRFTLPATVSWDAYERALSRYGTPPGLIDAPLPGDAAGPASPPPDLYDYGLPRLLVCQDPAIAVMLRANELPMESACPVYDLGALPLDPRVVAALVRGDATVHVLHDASTEGLRTVDRVRAAFDPPVRVNPLGLRPAHAAALHLTRRTGPPPTGAVTVDWQPWERRWLARGHVVEVAAVGPARLMRTVHRLVRGLRRTRSATPPLRRLAAVGYLTWPEP